MYELVSAREIMYTNGESLWIQLGLKLKKTHKKDKMIKTIRGWGVGGSGLVPLQVRGSGSVTKKSRIWKLWRLNFTLWDTCLPCCGRRGWEAEAGWRPRSGQRRQFCSLHIQNFLALIHILNSISAGTVCIAGSVADLDFLIPNSAVGILPLWGSFTYPFTPLWLILGSYIRHSYGVGWGGVDSLSICMYRCTHSLRSRQVWNPGSIPTPGRFLKSFSCTNSENRSA
jgi:hypothetical protein